MFAILRLLFPVQLGWMPDVDISAPIGATQEVRLMFGEGNAKPGDIVTLNARLEDQSGRVRSDSEARGLPLAFRLGDLDNDPLLDRAVRGMGSGGVCVMFSTFESGYLDWPTNRVLPAEGPMMLTVRVLRVSSTAQR
jgi:hypothetical protein